MEWQAGPDACCLSDTLEDTDSATDLVLGITQKVLTRARKGKPMSETGTIQPVDQQRLPLHKYSDQRIPLEKLTLWFYHAHCCEDADEIEQLEMAIEEIIQQNAKCAATGSERNENE